MVLGGSSDQGGPKPLAAGLPIAGPEASPGRNPGCGDVFWDTSTQAQLPTTRSLTSSGRRSADKTSLSTL